ncbi:keratin-associated protein 19-2-like [Musca vetustissima]|uniref:keratin-associated protein 19-2-like n=1 Tax=Musca vetustissima TaxID=27455 RepID=UPI002AB7BE5A|nr:keratin-associated protein 19-2-like [Musca vetustissima]
MKFILFASLFCALLVLIAASEVDVNDADQGLVREKRQFGYGGFGRGYGGGFGRGFGYGGLGGGYGGFGRGFGYGRYGGLGYGPYGGFGYGR